MTSHHPAPRLLLTRRQALRTALGAAGVTVLGHTVLGHWGSPLWAAPRAGG